ncbi:MAG: hypothetical protein JJE51_00065 [Thermoanaerobaculia bacterium]|nr:hypothetical protein [Thermoanaerobaculia bacterium]
MHTELNEFDSTLIRRGRSALSFADMVAFAQTVHDRPIDKLLEELPQIARLSDTKFNLATKVLRRRFCSEGGDDQIKLRVIGNDIAANSSSIWVADRIRSIFIGEDSDTEIKSAFVGAE